MSWLGHNFLLLDLREFFFRFRVGGGGVGGGGVGGADGKT